jgi:hypothetical protein
MDESDKPSTRKLMRAMASKVEPWKKMLSERLKVSAPVVDGLSTSIYALPHYTRRFVRNGWKRRER